MLAKARDRGADALIVDLEDAVAWDAKEEARSTVAEWLDNSPDGGPEVWVRINSHADLQHADLASVVVAGLRGIYVPKVDGPEALVTLDAQISSLEGDRGLDAGTISVAALIESAVGLQAVTAIAGAPRLTRLALGEADLGADLGFEESADDGHWIPIRLQVLVASVAAGLEPPVGPVSTNFRDLDALRASTTALRSIGYRCRAVIHPAQVSVVNDVFTPTEEETERARGLVALYEASVRDGRGAILDEEGRMVDEAVVRSARRTLEFSEVASS